MFEIEERPYLTLVYSADADRFSTFSKGDELGNSKADPWQQIELFASEQPDTVIFASPEKCHLASLVALMASAHVRQIFDFRELPHLAFEGSTRARFFEALSGLDVKYFSSMEIETGEPVLREQGAVNVLTKWVEEGPTMVFSDLDPALDPDIQGLNASLSKSGVNFKPVFLTLREAG